MDKIKLNQHFENVERVEKAFHDFIYALVWESINVCAGVEEDVINNIIDNYCKAYGNLSIMAQLEKVSEYVKNLESRYEVHCYECDEFGDVNEETAKHFDTDNEVLALKKAAEFYRYAKNPQVNIYDNKQNKYIAEWD